MKPFALVVLRTLIGWHFAYEGYYKLMLPGWSRGGASGARAKVVYLSPDMNAAAPEIAAPECFWPGDGHASQTVD